MHTNGLLPNPWTFVLIPFILFIIIIIIYSKQEVSWPSSLFIAFIDAALRRWTVCTDFTYAFFVWFWRICFYETPFNHIGEIKWGHPTWKTQLLDIKSRRFLCYTSSSSDEVSAIVRKGHCSGIEFTACSSCRRYEAQSWNESGFCSQNCLVKYLLMLIANVSEKQLRICYLFDKRCSEVGNIFQIRLRGTLFCVVFTISCSSVFCWTLIFSLSYRQAFSHFL